MKLPSVSSSLVLFLAIAITSSPTFAGGGDHGAGNKITISQQQQVTSNGQQQQQQQQLIECVNGEKPTVSVESTFDFNGTLISELGTYTCQLPHACEVNYIWQGRVTRVVNSQKQIVSISTSGECVRNPEQQQQQQQTQSSGNNLTSPTAAENNIHLLQSEVILPSLNNPYLLSRSAEIITLENGTRIHTGLERRVACQGSACLNDENGPYTYYAVNVGCGNFNQQMQYGAISLNTKQIVVFNQGKLIVVCQ